MMKRRIATVFAVAAGFVLLGAGAAYADASITSVNDRGLAVWTENGDTLTVCDLVGDGLGARGYIYTPTPGDPANGTVLIKASDGNATDGCVSVSKNISETSTIGIKICSYAGSVVNNCRYGILSSR